MIRLITLLLIVSLPWGQANAQRPIELSDDKELYASMGWCKFSPSGENFFWSSRHKLRIYRCADGSLQREVEIPNIDVHPSHP